MRGHERDINCVKWSWFSNTITNGGADQIVGLSDAREGAIVSRGIGHFGAVFGAAPVLNENSMASVDASGEIKVWDVRKMMPIYENLYPSSLQRVRDGPDAVPRLRRI
jgi:WD40 repeat protein